MTVTGGDVQAITTTGQKVIFEPEGTGYKAPAGYQNFKLVKIATPEAYEIRAPSGGYTRFEQSGPVNQFLPAVVGQAVEAGG